MLMICKSMCFNRMSGRVFSGQVIQYGKYIICKLQIFHNVNNSIYIHKPTFIFNRHVYIGLGIYMSMSICLYVYTSICLYAYICVCMCIEVYTLSVYFLRCWSLSKQKKQKDICIYAYMYIWMHRCIDSYVHTCINA